MKRKPKRRPSFADIDRTILSFCDKGWLKTARILGNTMQAFEKLGVNRLVPLLDARMAALVRGGRFEAKGIIRHWRYSEVRLPATPGKTVAEELR